MGPEPGGTLVRPVARQSTKPVSPIANGPANWPGMDQALHSGQVRSCGKAAQSHLCTALCCWLPQRLPLVEMDTGVGMLLVVECSLLLLFRLGCLSMHCWLQSLGVHCSCAQPWCTQLLSLLAAAFPSMVPQAFRLLCMQDMGLMGHYGNSLAHMYAQGQHANASSYEAAAREQQRMAAFDSMRHPYHPGPPSGGPPQQSMYRQVASPEAQVSSAAHMLSA